ncbi:hypothetical protein DOM21_13190 [Bacteriovorax stolpii]|uniref:hypothetical protein n=1 Tax=Bacteriovorax stolpii TaxID=960 RepID=UPI001159D459|nr:hypothetical protein [Bacteriovorax stolpii]QDK42381.1 hypothetical protein DOM21_13190 [Bacteriovorax stolpii]
MSKRSIIDIMEDMDRVEEIEITDDLVDTLRDYFKEEIESEDLENDENEKVAKGLDDSFINTDEGDAENGESDRV